MKTYNQVILNEKGNSWLNVHVSSKKMDETLKELMRIVSYRKNNPEDNPEWKNQIWVIDFDGTVRAAQKSLELALRYYKSDRSILVHSNETFY